MFKRLTREQQLADIRLRLQQGYNEATAERIVAIAEREVDVQILRQLVVIACEALANPRKKKPGRPTKRTVRNADGSFNLSATPARTSEETFQVIREIIRDAGIAEEIERAPGKLAAIDLVAQKAHVSPSKVKQIRYGKSSKKP